MDSNVYDVIIIGGGPGGLSAAIFALRAAMKTLLIERGSLGGQMAITKDIDNYPGLKTISGFDLSDKFQEHAESYGLEILNEEVALIKPGRGFHSVALQNGRTIKAHAIILATGGTARKLDVPGEEENLGRGVSYCATCDGFFFRGKKVVVVGGGDTALTETIYLSKITRYVYLVHRGDNFRACSVLQKHVFAESNIEVIRKSIVREIKANGEGVNAVVLKDLENGREKELDVEGIFIFVGFKPLNHLVPVEVKRSESGYVVTDEKCETNIPGLYAIGDLRQKYANQIVVAASDGCLAGLASARYVELRKAGCKEYWRQESEHSSPTQMVDCAA